MKEQESTNNNLVQKLQAKNKQCEMLEQELQDLNKTAALQSERFKQEVGKFDCIPVITQGSLQRIYY